MKKFEYFVLGVGIGVVLALLFAPEPGSEVRKKIKEKIRKANPEEKLAKVRSLFSKFEVE